MIYLTAQTQCSVSTQKAEIDMLISITKCSQRTLMTTLAVMVSCIAALAFWIPQTEAVIPPPSPSQGYSNLASESCVTTDDASPRPNYLTHTVDVVYSDYGRRVVPRSAVVTTTGKDGVGGTSRISGYVDSNRTSPSKFAPTSYDARDLPAHSKPIVLASASIPKVADPLVKVTIVTDIRFWPWDSKCSVTVRLR